MIFLHNKKGNRMASDISFVEFIVDQIQNAGKITYRKMFGEYAIYNDTKVIGLICNNQFFLKPTEGGRSFIGDVIEAPPYPGAKLHFLIEDKVEDRELLIAEVHTKVEDCFDTLKDLDLWKAYRETYCLY